MLSTGALPIELPRHEWRRERDLNSQPTVPGRIRAWLSTAMMMKLERNNEEEDENNDHEEAALYS